ncbi:MAG: protein translocase subunit SecD [Candidatus Neomarinimicrobiota bacterium]
MNKNLTPRFIIIALVLAWAAYSLWPTVNYQMLSDEKIEEMREAGTLFDLESKIIKQGLDLKGGMYIVLEVDIPTLVSNLAINRDARLDSILADITIQLSNPEVDFFSLFEDLVTRDNLRITRYFHDLGGNTEDIITQLKEEADDAINRVLEILQNRVDQFGVSEPTIQKQGNHRIIVELAGIQDTERARALLQSTALLEFYLVKNPETTNDLLIQIDNILKGVESIEDIATVDTTPDSVAVVRPEPQIAEDRTISVSELFGDAPVAANIDVEDTAIVVDQRLFEEQPFKSLLRQYANEIAVPEANVYAVKKILDLPEVKDRLITASSKFLFGDKPISLEEVGGREENIFQLYNVEIEPELTGGVVDEAREQIAGQGSEISGQSIVILNMNSEGAKQWSRITGANIGRNIAIVLDNKVHMSPRIREKIPSGGTSIEGFADINEAKDIAIVLRAGALPAPVNIIEERIVGPSLGADSIRNGTRSVLIGLILVMVFVLIYYKVSGLIADFALMWNIVLVLAVLASLQATLTLPGIAGLILTMGMSIDSNVIIFERIREELRKGKTPRAAVDSGYSRALTTIIDANITTVIAALVLYQFGTGPIRGFATVLFWGIIISMFTAIFVTRTIFNSFTARKGLKRLSI